MKELTLIIPAKNEAESLPIVLSELDKYNFKIDIILHPSDIQTIQAIQKYNINIGYQKNMGYGAAIKTGLKNCRNEWIFQTDGDAEYDVNDLLKLMKKTKVSDLVVTYRLKKKYKTSRIVISWIYNVILRILFHTDFKDISTGSRLINRSILKKIKLISNSPFLGAELAIKSKYKGFKVSEVGINTYPRTFGTGSSVSLENILLTIKEMVTLFIKIKI